MIPAVSQPLFGDRSNGLHWASAGTLQRAFPYNQRAPTLPAQSGDVFRIPYDVCLEFLAPFFGICRRPLEKVALVTMPEAAIDENYGPILGKDDIRPSGKAPRVQPEPEPTPMQLTPDGELGRRVLAPDSCHHPGSCRSVDYVCHKHPFVPGVRILTPGIL